MKFEIYRKAIDFGELEELINLLVNNNIPYRLEETKNSTDIIQVNYNSGFNYFLSIDPDDRSKVDELVSKNFTISFDDIPKDYYLLEYENDELLEIIAFSHEWSNYDCIIAALILKERGINPSEISVDKFNQIKLKNELETEPSPKLWLIIGYSSSILGGVLGIVIGLTMWLSKKTLSNGKRVYDFDEKDRKQGRSITIIGFASFIVWVYVWKNIK